VGYGPNAAWIANPLLPQGPPDRGRPSLAALPPREHGIASGIRRHPGESGAVRMRDRGGRRPGRVSPRVC